MICVDLLSKDHAIKTYLTAFVGEKGARLGCSLRIEAFGGQSLLPFFKFLIWFERREKLGSQRAKRHWNA